MKKSTFLKIGIFFFRAYNPHAQTIKPMPNTGWLVSQGDMARLETLPQAWVAHHEMVADEYDQVRFLDNAQTEISDRTEIQFFEGSHTINGRNL